MTLTSTWQFWAVLSAVFAAATALLAKAGVQEIDPDAATFIRTMVVAIALGALLLAVGKLPTLAQIDGRSAVFLVLSGLATGASWLCYFRAMKIGQASQVAPVDKLSVVLVAIFAAAFLGERLSAANWVGVALIAVGAILVGWR